MSASKQVERTHYEYKKYMSKERWASVWYQLDEVMNINPETVLEIGPGPGVFKTLALNFGLSVKTMDHDPELKPDYVGSASSIPFLDSCIDVTCAFQVLEHMPFEESLKAFKEMCRVARRAVIISLPHSGMCWPNTISLPFVRRFKFLIYNPFKKKQIHTFDGQHHWEIDKSGYGLASIIKALSAAAPPATRLKTYRLHENPYHRIFVFEFPRENI